jgi:signal transduction histidine kinase
MLKKTSLLFIVFLLCAWGTYALPDSLKTLRRELLAAKRVDSATFWRYATMCLREKQYAELVADYRMLLDSARRDLLKDDQAILVPLCAGIDTVNINENTVFLFDITGRLYTRYHLDNTSALNYFLKSIRIAERLKDPCLIIKGYSGMGTFYMNVKHDIVVANSYFEKIDSVLVATNMNGISECNVDVNQRRAVLNYYMADYAAGINYLDKSIVIARKFRLPQKLFDLYIRRSNFEIELGDRAKALRSLDTLEAIIANEPNADRLKQLINSYRFNIAVQNGEFQQAREISKGIAPERLNGTNDEYYDYLFHLAQMNIHFGDYAEAEKNVDLYQSDLKPWNIQRWRCVYQVRYMLNKASGHYGDALKYYEQYTRLNDSVHHQQQIFAVIAEQIKFNTKQKEEALNLQIAINETQSKNTKVIVLFFITICLVLLLALGYRSNMALREKERMNRAFTRKLLQNSEEMQNRLAHELHDGLGQELLLLKNGLILENNTAKADMVADVIESVRGMSRELYPALLDMVGLQTAIESQLQKVDQAEDIFISSEIEFAGKLDKYTALQVYRVFQEALTNVLKYANATSVYVALKQEGGVIRLTVKDNGVGFDVDEQNSSTATFGLQTMQRRAESINAKLKISSVKNKGTEVSLELPDNENINRR